VIHPEAGGDFEGERRGLIPHLSACSLKGSLNGASRFRVPIAFEAEARLQDHAQRVGLIDREQSFNVRQSLLQLPQFLMKERPMNKSPSIVRMFLQQIVEGLERQPILIVVQQAVDPFDIAQSAIATEFQFPAAAAQAGLVDVACHDRIRFSSVLGKSSAWFTSA